MRVTAPGKLMLSGEWSVLENGVPCIVMAIDQKVSVEINESEEMILSAEGTTHETKARFENGEIIIEKEDEKEFFLFVAKSIEASLKYLKDLGVEIKNFSIKTNSSDTVVDLENGTKAKVGFGSSAAIVAATVAAVLALHGENISQLDTKEKIFKLGCISHYLAQGKIGSSFDVAASTYGETLIYQKPDMKWLIEELKNNNNNNNNIKEVLEKNWPFFRAEPINLLEDFNLSIGFVGYSASTKELVLKLEDFKKSNKIEYDKIIFDIKTVTEKLITAIRSQDKSEIISLLKQNRVLLKEFSNKSNNNLETLELAKLSDLADNAGGVGKFSGAGGGDCGIAISFDLETKNRIENDWKENNIYLINASISKEGVIIE